MHIPQGKTPLGVWRAWARPFIGSAKHRCSAPGRPGSARARTLSTLLAAQFGAEGTPTTSRERGGRGVPLTPAMSLELRPSLLPASSKSRPNPD